MEENGSKISQQNTEEKLFKDEKSIDNVKNSFSIKNTMPGTVRVDPFFNGIFMFVPLNVE